ncbi:MAG TPA: hypothetical protein VI911_12245, partial [Patescibacteria group bacterium]|nr:hypothetical protein [Patescibacteria group bacterium]
MAEKYSPVLPSSLLEQAGDEFDGFKSTYNNFSLKTGIILKSYDIDDVNNISKNFVEYDVIAIESQGNLATGPVIFKKCPSLEGFGGVANFYEAKLKASSNDKVKYDGEIAKSDGSVVLLLCINGNEDSAMIIGSSKHPARKTTLTKEAGQHLEGEYNGVNWQVNKDGELTITFKSPSSIDNQKVKYKDEKAKGTYLKIDKTGSIDINDGATENIKIDKTNKTIGIKADKDVSVSTNG